MPSAPTSRATPPLPRPCLVLRAPGVEAWWTALIWTLSIAVLLYGYGTSGLRHGYDASGPEDPWARLGRLLFEAAAVGFAVSGVALAAPALWRRPALLLAAPLLGYGAFVLTRVLASGLGTEPGWLRILPFEALLVLAITVVPRPEPLAWLAMLERALRVLFVWLTVVLVVAIYSQVVQRSYTEGYIPGFNKRLHGTLHANDLASLLFVYLAVLAQLGRMRGWRVLDVAHAMLAFVLLLATQSKTTIAATAMAGAWHAITAFAHLRPLARLGAVVAALVAAGTLLLASLNAERVNDAIARRLEERRQTLESLTGRERIWAITLEKWRENPWFGYGPLLWGPEMSESYRTQLGWAPPHAHSQYLHVLGSAGLPGLAALIAYLAIMTTLAVRCIRTWPIATYLVGYALLRGGFEVIFGLRTPRTIPFVLLMHATVLVAAYRARAAARPEAAA